MGAIGPALPPHLAGKRKRSESDSSEDGPAPPSTGPSKVSGPTLPPPDNQDVSNKPSREETRRVMGPSLPPVSLEEMPPDAAPSPPAKKRSTDDESSDDDDLGPAPPPPLGASATVGPSWEEVRQPSSAAPSASKPLQREEWMLAPPSGADWAQRIDPTKLKNRKFNTMKGAKAAPQAGGNVGGLWTETPEEKRKRLEDEMMGTKANESSRQDRSTEDQARRRNLDEDRETERKVREYNETHRGSASLLDRHRARSKKEGKEVDDDPSKRAFDREKDIAGGAFSSMERRQVMNRAKDMGSRFEKARYL